MNNLNRKYLAVPIIIGLIVLITSCKNKNTEIYTYQAYLKTTSINNSYNTEGYATPNAGGYCKWGEAQKNNSILVLDMGKETFTILNENYKEIFDISDTHKIQNQKIAFSYVLTAYNKYDDKCYIAFSDMGYSIIIQVSPYHMPATMYMVEDFDYKELLQELKKELSRIPNK